MRIIIVALCLFIFSKANATTEEKFEKTIDSAESMVFIDHNKSLLILQEYSLTYKNFSELNQFKYNTVAGSAYIYSDQIKKVRFHLDESLNIIKKNNYEINKYLALMYNLQGDYYSYYEQGDAEESYRKSLNYFTILNDNIGKFITYSNLSFDYMEKFKFVMALDYAQKAISLADKINEPSLTANINDIMGSIYTFMEDNENALEYRTKAMNIYKEINHENFFVSSKISVAGSMIDLKRYYQAENLLLSVIENKITLTGEKFISYQILAESYAEQGLYKKSEESLNKAKEYMSHIESNSSIVRWHIYKLTAFIGQNKIKKAEATLKLLESKNFIDKTYINSRNYFKLEKQKSRLYEIKNEYKLSLKHYKIYSEQWQKFKNSSSTNLVHELKIKYKTDKAENDNLDLYHQNELSKLMLLQSEKNEKFHILLISCGIFIIIFVSGLLIYQVKFKKKLLNMVKKDPLTTIFNRSYLMRKGEKLYSTENKRRSINSVILLDIDNFKSINDTYGHSVGDIVLKEIAICGSTSVREHDTFARFGGEEFVALLPYTTSDQALVIAERIRASIASLEWLKYGIHKNITVSVGITSLSNKDQGGFNHALNLADKAMYRAKNTGKNKVVSI